jgi:hypothetical protein
MAAKFRSGDSSVETTGTGRPFRVERLFADPYGVLLSLRLRAAAFEVRVPELRVAVAPCILAGPALMAALGLDFLPDNWVVLCADKGVAPPVGRAKDLQQPGLDGIDVLEPLFQGVLVFVSRPHDNHHSLSVRLGIPCRYGLALPVCTGSGHREIRFLMGYAHRASIGSFRRVRARTA